MLQNEKYLEFAEESTVEILALGSIPGVDDPKDRRTETYEGKDADGKPVRYMKEFAGCTLEQLNALNSSPAGQYNKTGKIPYVCLVDPWTLQEITQIKGVSVGGIGKAVAEAQANLTKAHGSPLKRSSLKKVQTGAKNVEATLEKDGAAKAFAEFAKLETGVAKEPESLKAKLAPVKEKLLEAAKADLDKAEGLIGSGDLKGATAILNPLKSGLKGTDLEAKLKELLDKTKPAPEAK